MLIYLDLDGTCVEHEYPKMGRENFGCIPVIQKLMDAGHKVWLNTYRADISEVEHVAAISWLRYRVDGNFYFLSMKEHPHPFDIVEFIKFGLMFIDDHAPDIPLKPAVMTRGNMVDWDALDKLFTEHKLYEKV